MWRDRSQQHGAGTPVIQAESVTRSALNLFQTDPGEIVLDHVAACVKAQ